MWSFIVRVQMIKPAAPSCIELSQWVFYGLNSSRVGWEAWKASGFSVEPYEEPFRLDSDKNSHFATAA
jgi:hypothetical protein